MPNRHNTLQHRSWIIPRASNIGEYPLDFFVGQEAKT